MSRIYKIIRIQIIIFFLLLLAVALFAQETRQLTVDKPLAVADLKTIEGAALINAKWFVQPAHVQDKEFRLPGPQQSGGDALLLYPTGKAVKTHTLHPQIGAADFETGFREIKSSQLEERQGTGLFSFVWYKIELTLPSTIGNLNTGTGFWSNWKWIDQRIQYKKPCAAHQQCKA
jgi:gluconolactonase